MAHTKDISMKPMFREFILFIEGILKKKWKSISDLRKLVKKDPRFTSFCEANGGMAEVLETSPLIGCAETHIGPIYFLKAAGVPNIVSEGSCPFESNKSYRRNDTHSDHLEEYTISVTGVPMMRVTRLKDHLNEMFQKYGEVDTIRVLTDGKVFIYYFDRVSVLNAVRECRRNGVKLFTCFPLAVRTLVDCDSDEDYFDSETDDEHAGDEKRRRPALRVTVQDSSDEVIIPDTQMQREFRSLTNFHDNSHPSSWTLHVRGYSQPNSNDELRRDLFRTFRSFGKIETIVPHHHNYSFVNFYSEKPVLAAVAKSGEISMNGETVYTGYRVPDGKPAATPPRGASMRSPIRKNIFNKPKTPVTIKPAKVLAGGTVVPVKRNLTSPMVTSNSAWGRPKAGVTHFGSEDRKDDAIVGRRRKNSTSSTHSASHQHNEENNSSRNNNITNKEKSYEPPSSNSSGRNSYQKDKEYIHRSVDDNNSAFGSDEDISSDSDSEDDGSNDVPWYENTVMTPKLEAEFKRMPEFHRNDNPTSWTLFVYGYDHTAFKNSNEIRKAIFRTFRQFGRIETVVPYSSPTSCHCFVNFQSKAPVDKAIRASDRIVMDDFILKTKHKSVGKLEHRQEIERASPRRPNRTPTSNSSGNWFKSGPNSVSSNTSQVSKTPTTPGRSRFPAPRTPGRAGGVPRTPQRTPQRTPNRNIPRSPAESPVIKSVWGRVRSPGPRVPLSDLLEKQPSNGRRKLPVHPSSPPRKGMEPSPVLKPTKLTLSLESPNDKEDNIPSTLGSNSSTNTNNSLPSSSVMKPPTSKRNTVWNSADHKAVLSRKPPTPSARNPSSVKSSDSSISSKRQEAIKASNEMVQDNDNEGINNSGKTSPSLPKSNLPILDDGLLPSSIGDVQIPKPLVSPLPIRRSRDLTNNTETIKQRPIFDLNLSPEANNAMPIPSREENNHDSGNNKDHSTTNDENNANKKPVPFELSLEDDFAKFMNLSSIEKKPKTSNASNLSENESTPRGAIFDNWRNPSSGVGSSDGYSLLDSLSSKSAVPPIKLDDKPLMQPSITPLAANTPNESAFNFSEMMNHFNKVKSEVAPPPGFFGRDSSADSNARRNSISSLSSNPGSNDIPSNNAGTGVRKPISPDVGTPGIPPPGNNSNLPRMMPSVPQSPGGSFMNFNTRASPIAHQQQRIPVSPYFQQPPHQHYGGVPTQQPSPHHYHQQPHQQYYQHQQSHVPASDMWSGARRTKEGTGFFDSPWTPTSERNATTEEGLMESFEALFSGSNKNSNSGGSSNDKSTIESFMPSAVSSGLLSSSSSSAKNGGDTLNQKEKDSNREGDSMSWLNSPMWQS
eukprot:TRINITY_DN4908_c0_g1_i1.p1 TRINITY_DN4908_c0_g1~~TRINITY_DN4908_c0_g1_i1.p1  ORF type:complete len:1334 (-),score=440.29 TRINITY_DN4908_c0_g1_i1:287-4288(-)